MAVWALLLIVFGAGLIGGTINALMSDNGFTFPKQQDGILRPGWLGNALVGEEFIFDFNLQVAGWPE